MSRSHSVIGPNASQAEATQAYLNAVKSCESIGLKLELEEKEIDAPPSYHRSYAMMAFYGMHPAMMQGTQEPKVLFRLTAKNSTYRFETIQEVLAFKKAVEEFRSGYLVLEGIRTESETNYKYRKEEQDRRDTELSTLQREKYNWTNEKRNGEATITRLKAEVEKLKAGTAPSTAQIAAQQPISQQIVLRDKKGKFQSTIK